MAARDRTVRLIVNADDFGASSAVNQAVLRAFREGILTTASLMVTGAAFAEAVEIAHANPGLGVGLHLTLVEGESVLPLSLAYDLLDHRRRFSDNPAYAGWRYFFDPRLAVQLHHEIAAQLDKFHATGLTLDHVNGHMHMHMHPVVMRMLLELAPTHGISAIRLTREPWERDLVSRGGRWCYRLSHSLVFEALSRRIAPALSSRGIRHTDGVFGLLQTSRMGIRYFDRFLGEVPSGCWEVYSHPSLAGEGDEFQGLISETSRRWVDQRGIRLIRYQDL